MTELRNFTCAVQPKMLAVENQLSFLRSTHGLRQRCSS